MKHKSQITGLEKILKKFKNPKCMVEINHNCTPFYKYLTNLFGRGVGEGQKNKEKEEKIIKDKTNLFC
jgi:hypothetical protein